MADPTIANYVPPQWQDFRFPQFNQPGFPYQDQPQQTAASIAQGNGPFSNGSQYGRWNGLNNGGLGLGSSQAPALFNGQPPPMQYQPPWGSNPGANAGLPPIPPGAPSGSQWTQGQPGSQQPPIAPGMNLPALAPGQSPFGAAQGPAKVAPIAPAPQTAPWNQAQGSMWGNSTGPVNVNSLTPQDQLFAQKMLHIPGMSGMIGNMLQGSNLDVRNALSTLGGQADPYDNASQVNNYDPSTYTGQLKPLFQQYFANNPQAVQQAAAAGYGNLFGSP